MDRKTSTTERNRTQLNDLEVYLPAMPADDIVARLRRLTRRVAPN